MHNLSNHKQLANAYLPTQSGTAATAAAIRHKQLVGCLWSYLESVDQVASSSAPIFPQSASVANPDSDIPVTFVIARQIESGQSSL